MKTNLAFLLTLIIGIIPSVQAKKPIKAQKMLPEEVSYLAPSDTKNPKKITTWQSECRSLYGAYFQATITAQPTVANKNSVEGKITINAYTDQAQCGQEKLAFGSVTVDRYSFSTFKDTTHHDEWEPREFNDTMIKLDLSAINYNLNRFNKLMDDITGLTQSKDNPLSTTDLSSSIIIKGKHFYFPTDDYDMLAIQISGTEPIMLKKIN